MERSGNEPEKEHYGEASLGEAQSSDPPADPEMIREDAPEPVIDAGESAPLERPEPDEEEAP